jgi:dTDP-4-dehydrorhamnose reductase
LIKQLIRERPENSLCRVLINEGKGRCSTAGVTEDLTETTSAPKGRRRITAVPSGRAMNHAAVTRPSRRSLASTQWKL